MADAGTGGSTGERVDLLYGLRAIANHLGMTPRKAQHLVDKGALPTFKSGKIICSTKAAIAEHFAEQMQRVGKA